MTRGSKACVMGCAEFQQRSEDVRWLAISFRGVTGDVSTSRHISSRHAVDMVAFAKARTGSDCEATPHHCA